MDSRLIRSVMLGLCAIGVGAISPILVGFEFGLIVLLFGLGTATLVHAHWLYRGGTTLDARFLVAIIIVMSGTIAGASIDLLAAVHPPTIPIALIAVCLLLIPLDVRGYSYYKRIHGGE